jgi:hypothetical protein
MEATTAIKLIADFKGTSLQLRLNEIQNQLVGKSQIIDFNQSELFGAALTVKNISTQIDEIVHAAGILNSLPAILHENEKIQEISLAAGTGKGRFDLVTDYRVAEFKFSYWKKSNGIRGKKVFSDYVNLLLDPSGKKKELYVVSFAEVKSFFQSEAEWKKMLSKSDRLAVRLQEYLIANKLEAETVNDIFKLGEAEIEIFDINKIMTNYQSSSTEAIKS